MNPGSLPDAVDPSDGEKRMVMSMRTLPGGQEDDPSFPRYSASPLTEARGVGRSYPMRVAPPSLGPRRHFPCFEGRNDMMGSGRFDHHEQILLLSSTPHLLLSLSLLSFSSITGSLGSKYHSATPITTKQSIYIYIQGQATGSYSIGRWTSIYRHQIFSYSATSRLDRSS